MSEQNVVQKSSSDFSIARILASDTIHDLKNERNPYNLLKIDCNSRVIKQIKCDREVISSSENRVLNESKNEVRNERLERDEQETRLSEETWNITSKSHVVDLKKFKELPWLQCTRFSPPKLPRKPPSGKQIKRRLGSQPRIPFSKTQVQILEEKYQMSAYLTRRDVIQLAETLNLPQNRIKIWFQNRRAREKRESQSNKTTS